VGTYSFDFAKNITTGEGGMLVTGDAKLYEHARAYHDHGHEYNETLPRGRDTRSRAGFNFRMTEVQAVLGLTQLKKLKFIVTRQRENKAAIKEGIAECGFPFRRLHDSAGDVGDTLIFLLDSEKTALRFAERLGALRLGTKNLPDALTWHFAGTWEHLFRGYPHLSEPAHRWPRTADLLRRAIALPVNVRMSEQDLAKVVQAVKMIARELS
jgi:8-amino-3,8-dideoxy-alpha-D-manno-octulosonate transaminase